MACTQALSAIGAGHARFALFYVFEIQGIIPALQGAGHTGGAIIRYRHPEWGNNPEIIYHGSDGAVKGAVEHLVSAAGYEKYDGKTDYTG
jgi:hypothetical protein